MSTPSGVEIPGISIETEIGRGAMGVVYRGQQIFLDRTVAVKVLFCESENQHDFLKRFSREARIVANLSHPNIVSCYMAGTLECGSAYLVMEHIDGPTLQSWIEKVGPLSELEALDVTRCLALALQYADSHDVIHRDVKAANVLLHDLEGEAYPFPFGVKLVDLGLARTVDSDQADPSVTQTGIVFGTPTTMAPEQIDGLPDLDFRVDVYGLGCILYRMLTGFSAFGGKITTIIDRKLKGQVTDPRNLRPGIRTQVVALLRDMLAPDRDDRPSSYPVLIETLGDLLHSAPPRSEKTAETPRRPKSVRLPTQDRDNSAFLPPIDNANDETQNMGESTAARLRVRKISNPHSGHDKIDELSDWLLPAHRTRRKDDLDDWLLPPARKRRMKLG